MHLVVSGGGGDYIRGAMPGDSMQMHQPNQILLERTVASENLSYVVRSKCESPRMNRHWDKLRLYNEVGSLESIRKSYQYLPYEKCILCITIPHIAFRTYLRVHSGTN